MPEYDDIVSIGVGHNVALLSLTLVTSISVSSVPFLRLLTPARYTRGEKRIKANGAPDRSGFKSKKFISGFMTLAQFAYLCGTYEGPITVYSWLDTTTPARYNAMLDMGDEEDYESINTVEYGWGLKDVQWTLTKIQVLA